MHYFVYTDGSYREVKGVGNFVASAAIVQREGQDINEATGIVKVMTDPDLLKLRNVAGEIMAVMLAMEHCMNVLHLNQSDTVTLCHDYIGLHNWLRKKGDKEYWRCKNPTTQTYRDYMNTRVRTTFRLEFNHTPSHTGILGNEVADKLATDAIDTRIKQLLGDLK